MVTDMVRADVTDMEKGMDLKAVSITERNMDRKVAIIMVKDVVLCMDMARDTAENTIVALAEREFWK